MVDIKASTMPNLSWMTLARGARQFVVQEALEICQDKMKAAISVMEEE